MQYYCQLHQSIFTSVCIQQDCTKKGPLCDKCTDTHKNHVMQNLETYFNDYTKYLNMEYQAQILQKLDQMKQYFHDKISSLQIDVNFIDEKRKKEIMKQLKQEKMSPQQFQSKVIELIQRDQLKDREYLEQFFTQIVEIEKNMKFQFSQLPKKFIQAQHHHQPSHQSQQIINNKSNLSSEVRELSPQLSNRSNKSKEPIFSQKQTSQSPLSKQLLQRDLMPVGSFNNSKLKNYFTEQDSQVSPQNSFKIVKPFDIDKSSNYQSRIEGDRSKSKSQNASFDQFKKVEPFKNVQQSQIIEVPLTTKFEKSEQLDLLYNQKQSSNNLQELPQQQIVGYYSNQRTLTQKENKESLQKSPSNTKVQFSIKEEKQVQSNSNPQQSEIYNQFQKSQVYESQNFDFGQKFQNQNQEVQLFQTPQQSTIIREKETNNFQNGMKLSAQSAISGIQNENKSQQDISFISSKSLISPQIKITQNLPNPLKIEKDETLKVHDKSVKDLCFMDDDKIITCSKDSTIKIWDKRTKQLKTELKDHTDQILCIAFSQKRIIVSGSVDKTVRIWKPSPSWRIAFVCQGHQERIRCVDFVGNFILSGSDDTTLKLWDLDGQLQHSFKTNGRVSAMITDKNLVIVGSDTKTKNKQQEIIGHKNLILCLQLSSLQNKRILLSGSKDHFVKIWSYPQIQEIRTFEDDYSIHSLFFDQSSQYLFLGQMGFEQEGKISIWKLDDQPKKKQEIISNPYGCNKVLYDGRYLYSAHENKRMEIYSINEL
ncbi:unnamed protein product (macronuclear) [Paramecium tetraurelia]|uniref:Uncharacterized protein n=1 Tax=Paramecium tetraurelia TaxID=5888 RepID=A0CWF8_PARTE|nr:uncharacterized protein GSPATT00001328001 [Paramecium tetraurelia]CAK75125.1 unnamed protein product [Paramecium tetraurelia]|eukprot:XP_001442522.1 hypothetical protein (macronuclear) [Paramecium tetraurelia strain d4-2]